MLKFLISLLISVLIPLAAFEFSIQYRGYFDLASLLAHQPALLGAGLLSAILTISLGLSRFRRTTPKTNADPATTLLALLQEQGRIIDFTAGDISAFPDAQVASAARIVHAGCKKVIEECFSPEPILKEQEGESVAGLDSPALKNIRLQGKVSKPPYTGKVLHRGWRATKNQLPIRESEVIKLAEVEVQS